MKLSKDMIQAIRNAGNDKKVPALSTALITEDGEIVVCNAKSIMMVEALPTERQESIPFTGDGKELEREIILPIKFLEEVDKIVPKDKQFDGLLEMLYLEEGTREGEVKVIAHDGKGEKTLKVNEYDGKYIDFIGILNNLYYNKSRAGKFVLDRKRLIDTLQTLDRMCGDNPSYIEITEEADLLIRSVIPNTGQRVMALVTGVVGEWLPKTEFEVKYERSKKESKNPKKKIRKRVKIKKRDKSITD